MNLMVNRLIEEVEKTTQFLVHNRRVNVDKVEKYYEFCYQVLLQARERYSSYNPDLVDELFKEDVDKIHLALHPMVFGNG